nr:MAG TPA: hypothetical protein [Caudoviricetes sp.]
MLVDGFCHLETLVTLPPVRVRAGCKFTNNTGT